MFKCTTAVIQNYVQRELYFDAYCSKKARSGALYAGFNETFQLNFIDILIFLAYSLSLIQQIVFLKQNCYNLEIFQGLLSE